MLVIGDLKCLHCGYSSGRWVGPKGTPLTAAGLRPLPPGRDPAEHVRCGRCQGPVYLDDAMPVASSYRLRRIQRMREQLAAFDAPRPKRGRAA
ncbi:hypothetical protein [Tepidiforma sp.]|jgi:hypothetical protein|uniref:hypothetical protein n=1 Tax=Tepidiforma sp. TaxID=2682230 RepID=UPI0026333A54|nr:hypothetical protein [Tepidiforma sp.]MCX7617943.1 hypothetical protein [Tepidiforma sp.]